MPTPGRPRVRVLRAQTIINRRLLVQQMYLFGRMTYEQITEELRESYGIEISTSIVCLDIQALQKQNAEDAKQANKVWVQGELAKLATMEEQIRVVMNPSYVLEPESGAPDLVEALQGCAKQVEGDVFRCTELLLKIQDRRARLLGLDAPRKVAVQGGDADKPIRIKELTDAELEAIITAAEHQG